MSAPEVVSPASSLALSPHEFAALGRLMGAELLLDGWIPPLSVAGWLAVVDGLWARGVLASADGGASYAASERWQPLLAVIAGARQARSVIVTSEGTTRARLTLDDGERFVEFEVPGDELPTLRGVTADEAEGRLLALLGPEARGEGEIEGEPPAATTIAYDVVTAALEEVAAGGQGSLDAVPGLAGAIAAPRAHCAIDARVLAAKGAASTQGFTWVEGADQGCWLLGGTEEGLAVRRASISEIRGAAEALLAP